MLKDKFKGEYDDWVFGKSDMSKAFQRLAETKEDSPWHRESSVLVHTNMVLDRYYEYAPAEWQRVDYLGAIACAFHDIAKPPCEVAKFKPERGHYRAYHGHELMSARMLEDYAVRGFLNLTHEEIFKTCWMVEHHLPWELKDKGKREAFAKTVREIGLEAFINVLRADQYGRISDDEDAKKMRVESWVRDFRELVASLRPEYRVTCDEQRYLHMPIAASGSGKSTFFRDGVDCNGLCPTPIFSLDNLRLEWYDNNDYSRAFAMAVKDKQFSSKANQRYLEMLRENKDIYIDNTNCARKARTFYLTEARRRGYILVAHLFPIDLQTILNRQKTRGDKCVPEDAVRRQYMSLQLPMYGEFDYIDIH